VPLGTPNDQPPQGPVPGVVSEEIATPTPEKTQGGPSNPDEPAVEPDVASLEDVQRLLKQSNFKPGHNMTEAEVQSFKKVGLEYTFLFLYFTRGSTPEFPTVEEIKAKEEEYIKLHGTENNKGAGKASGAPGAPASSLVLSSAPSPNLPHIRRQGIQYVGPGHE
jgi:hypothetical protein